MVAQAPTPERLSQLEERLASDWTGTQDPVRRLALLRRHFRLLHELLNEELAAVNSSDGLPLLRSRHDELAAFPVRHALTPPDVLRPQLLESGPTLGKPSPGAPQTESLPEFLGRPGREWEALLYRMAPHWGWKPSKREIQLETSSAIQELIQRERESVGQGALMLGLEKSPNGPHLWWMHELVDSQAALR